MRFSEERKYDLEGKLLKIFTECVLEAQRTKDLKYGEEWYFMEQVFKANLIEGDKHLFLLGALAQKVHDGGFEAMKKTIVIMGIGSDEVQKKGD